MPDPVFLDCRKPEGNAFSIMHAVRRHLRDAGLDEETIRELSYSMMHHGDYFELCRMAEQITDGAVVVTNLPSREALRRILS
jgi:hypothetical protein